MTGFYASMMFIGILLIIVSLVLIFNRAKLRRELIKKGRNLQNRCRSYGSGAEQIFRLYHFPSGAKE